MPAERQTTADHLDMIAHGSATVSNELYNQGLLYQFFSLLAQSPSLASRPEENIDNQYIAKAIEYIRFNYQPRSLFRISRIMYL